MNEENECVQIADADTVDRPIKRVLREEIMKALRYVKIVRAPGPTEVYAETIQASGDVGIGVLVELCHIILDGKVIPEDWASTVAIPIFKGKGDIMNCGMYCGVGLLEHAMKIIEKVIEKRLKNIFTIDDTQFCSMPGNGTIDAVITSWRLKEEYLAIQKKLYMCFVDLEQVF